MSEPAVGEPVGAAWHPSDSAPSQVAARVSFHTSRSGSGVLYLGPHIMRHCLVSLTPCHEEALHVLDPSEDHRAGLCAQIHGGGEKCSPHTFPATSAEIMVLAGTTGAGGMAPPTSTRTSARLKRVQGHVSPLKIAGLCVPTS